MAGLVGVEVVKEERVRATLPRKAERGAKIDETDPCAIPEGGTARRVECAKDTRDLLPRDGKQALLAIEERRDGIVVGGAEGVGGIVGGGLPARGGDGGNEHPRVRALGDEAADQRQPPIERDARLLPRVVGTDEQGDDIRVAGGIQEVVDALEIARAIAGGGDPLAADAVVAAASGKGRGVGGGELDGIGILPEAGGADIAPRGGKGIEEGFAPVGAIGGTMGEGHG